jgi:DNA-binding transcriptional ArsR family regulator
MERVSEVGAIAIGLTVIAMTFPAPAAATGVPPRHERVPLELIQRFPLTPRSTPAPTRKPPARPASRSQQLLAPKAGSKAVRRTGADTLALWLLITGCLCLVAGVWLVRRGSVPRASRLSSDEEHAPVGATFHRSRYTHPLPTVRVTALATPRGNGEEQRGLGRDAPSRVRLDTQNGIDREPFYRSADERAADDRMFNLGLFRETQGNVDGAEEAYRHAAERGHAAAATNLGVLLEEHGDRDGAEAAYRRADERKDAKGAFNLGMLLEEQGDVAAAREAYRRADQHRELEVTTMWGRTRIDVRERILEAAAAPGDQSIPRGNITQPERPDHENRTGRGKPAVVTSSGGRQASGPRKRAAPGETKKRVLAALADGGEKTAGQVTAATGLPGSTVSATLSRLVKAGEVVKVERRYRLAARDETNGQGPDGSASESSSG